MSNRPEAEVRALDRTVSVRPFQNRCESGTIKQAIAAINHHRLREWRCPFAEASGCPGPH